MKITKLNLTNQTILVVSPLYDQIDKLHQINTLCNEQSIIIFMGDICFPYKQTYEIVPRINILQAFMEDKSAYFVVGNHDLTYVAKCANIHADVCMWLQCQPRILKINYANGSNYLFLHGGIKPDHKTQNDLEEDLEVSFLEKWHSDYDGRFGFVISSHPSQENHQIKKYPHSLSVDTSAHQSKSIAIQEITTQGLGKLVYA